MVSLKRLLLLLPLCFGLGGCNAWLAQENSRFLASFNAVPPPVEAGKSHFRAGDYGLAETAFRRAVEEVPTDGEAWLGLAAAQDQLGRFDLADKSYAAAERLIGRTAAFFNNRGYSFLMRGDARRARRDLEAALRIDPSNAAVRTNLSQLTMRP